MNLRAFLCDQRVLGKSSCLETLPVLSDPAQPMPTLRPPGTDSTSKHDHLSPVSLQSTDMRVPIKAIGHA